VKSLLKSRAKLTLTSVKLGFYPEILVIHVIVIYHSKYIPAYFMIILVPSYIVEGLQIHGYRWVCACPVLPQLAHWVSSVTQQTGSIAGMPRGKSPHFTATILMPLL